MRALAIFAALALLAPTTAPAAGTSIPFGFVDFCKLHAAECQPSTRSAVTYSTTLMRELGRLNVTVNRAIRPLADVEEVWSIAPVAGDCDDYVMTKRHYLIEAGFPQSALRLAVVKTAAGEGPLVLVVVTTQGKFVLDNLRDDVHRLEHIDHKPVKISTADPFVWILF